MADGRVSKYRALAARSRSAAVRKRRSTAVAIPRAPTHATGGPLGDTQSANLRYVETISFTAGTTVTDYIYRANGLYDPNVSGVGHQPRGFDQMMAFFDHFCVTGSKCTVDFGGGVATMYQIGVALKAAPASFTGSTLDDCIEQNAANFQLVYPGGMVGKSSKTFSARKFFTVSDPVGEDELNGGTSSDPVEQAYFHVIMGSVGGVAGAGTTYCTVTIDYHVVFSEPKTLTSS